MINLFLVAGVKHRMAKHVSNTLNVWILFCKTWMTTENCYYKKLLKAQLTTSKDVPSAIYFSEFYISNLTVIIPSMFCRGAVETVKSCIGLSLLLANLNLQVVSFLVKRRLFLQLHISNFPVTKFLTVC